MAHAATLPTPSPQADSAEILARIVYADDLRAFTYDEVAGRLGVSPTTVEREVARGQLREKRVGRAVRITASSLRQYLDGDAA